MSRQRGSRGKDSGTGTVSASTITTLITQYSRPTPRQLFSCRVFGASEEMAVCGRDPMAHDGHPGRSSLNPRENHRELFCSASRSDMSFSLPPRGFRPRRLRTCATSLPGLPALDACATTMTKPGCLVAVARYSSPTASPVARLRLLPCFPFKLS